jgi:cell wall-associated NlpC family hydrolase
VSIWKPQSKKARNTRKRIVANADWIIHHAGPIHYAQTRPIDFNYRSLPWTADCSGSTTAIYKDAGAPDPTGNGYNGSGNTDSMYHHLPHIARHDARKGDLVLFRRGSDAVHVAVFMQTPRFHRDPWIESHGSEYGPLHVKLSTETTYHAGEEITFLRGVPIRY